MWQILNIYMEEQPIYEFKESEITSSNILIKVSCYPMTEEKFLRLISKSSKLMDVAQNIFYVAVGMLLKIIGVYIIIIKASYKREDTSGIVNKIEDWEYWSLFIAMLISAVCYVGSKCMKSDRNDLIKEIEIFFKKKKH